MNLHSTKYQLYGHLPPISQIIQVRQTRQGSLYWWSKNRFLRDVLLETPTHGRTSIDKPARTYIDQLSVDTGSCLEDLQRAMGEKDNWAERFRELRDICMLSWYI